ncbi:MULTISPECIES: SPOR domain-containing protein [unclassified Novosphingobium]|uniref:SPOR domain-containing protein n=1 Tax=unclassified Novosphingobium TaxID=2644732 RepID=UPI000EE995DA|nr:MULTISPECIES: SPOR domain-containing protein [unclassified Novosphingobium]HCF24541.1 sporulation protein SsgA [Novosphingobium sp.]HQV03355.1 SPOR domain-containing protein [Novosphingobium sp.]
MSESAVRMLKLCSTSILGLVWSGLALAQTAPLPQVAVPVVQAVPQKSAGMRLNDALGRLARSPQDIEALSEAGQASLELGDAQAAIGFYQRALALQPGNAQVKAGLAGAYVLSEDPFTAIELFDEAEKAGPINPARLADRGLAFDLVGDPQTAQFYYRQSLSAAPSDETLRRLGISQAITRDRKGMDITLAPLLQKQDKAAWRARAFGLAILGQTDEAEAIARQTMPLDLATAITAYLRYMPRLTAAQQAGAANLGRFPRASEIGNDDPRMAQYSRSRVKVAAAPPPPVPAASKGKGKKDDRGKKPVPTKPVAVAAAAPPPEPSVGRETTTAPVKLGQATFPPAPAPKPAPVPAPPPPPAPPAPAPAPQPGFGSLDSTPQRSASTFDLAKAPAQTAPPVPKPAPKPTSIDEAFADLAPPSREIEPQSGAVDVRRIRPGAPPAKEPPAGDKAKGSDKAADKAKAGDKTKGKDAKPATQTQPSRIWVQLATGRDKAALGFDWRKLVKDDPAVFKGLKPHVTAWGQANRLLAGPFASAKEANVFLAQLKKAGVSGAFLWTSPAGQVVDALGGSK